MYLNGNMAALCLAACVCLPHAAMAAPANHPTLTQSEPEVRTRDLLLFGAGLILLAGRRRPEHDTWQVRRWQD